MFNGSIGGVAHALRTDPDAVQDGCGRLFPRLLHGRAQDRQARFYTDLRLAQNVTQVPLGVEIAGTDDGFGTPLYDTVTKYPTEVILELGIGW